MYDFGTRLRELRRQRGLTQKDLAAKINKSIAAKINKSIAAISSYETGAQMPPGDVLKSIAYALNTSADYLLDIDKSNAITLKNLTIEQQDTLELILKEFSNPTNNGLILSPQQIDIIQRLILAFSK